MPTFVYKVKGADGNILEGVLDAPEERVALDRLKAQKLVVLEVGLKSVSFFEKLIARTPLGPKVGSKDLVLFSRQLSTLVSAGVPIVQGLSILEEQASNPAFRTVLIDVRIDIESGLSISDALKKHPQAFPQLYTSMVHAGEVGGILDIILERLSQYLESSETLKAKVKGAMMYPAVLLSICLAVTLFLLTFVIPTFKSIFAGFGAELPLPTQMLISFSDFLRSHALWVLASPVGLWYAFRKFKATEYGRNMIDAKVLKLPFLGLLLKKLAVARFTNTLGVLIKSGVPIMQALETVSATAGNVVIEKAILETRESIREGGRLAERLKKMDIFPPMVTQMISVGEETGSLDAMLAKISEFYEKEVDSAVKGLTTIMEPIVIVVMGVIIGTIVIAMFMPMFSLGELASKQG